MPVEKEWLWGKVSEHRSFLLRGGDEHDGIHTMTALSAEPSLHRRRQKSNRLDDQAIVINHNCLILSVVKLLS